MGIIEQAARRLEELRGAGVAVPWNAAGLAGSEFEKRVEDGTSEMLREPAVARLAGDARPARRVPRGLSPVTEAGTPVQSQGAREPECVTLDIAELQRAGHLVQTDSRSGLAEEFRHAKRPLLRNARDAQPEDRMSLIMVTSALPSEGKTFCAINLAMSIAIEIDMSVLLVDADVVRPDVLRRLGVPPHKGLLDLLSEGNVELDDLLLSTNVPKLSILPAGTYNTRSTELLASDAMNRLLADLAVRYRDHVVIFDAPPLLVTSEAKVLASRVGQVLVVVEASRTPRAAVERAFVTLQQCPTVMSLLNKGDKPAPSYGYGDYYG